MECYGIAGLCVMSPSYNLQEPCSTRKLSLSLSLCLGFSKGSIYLIYFVQASKQASERASEQASKQASKQKLYLTSVHINKKHQHNVLLTDKGNPERMAARCLEWVLHSMLMEMLPQVASNQSKLAMIMISSATEEDLIYTTCWFWTFWYCKDFVQAGLHRYYSLAIYCRVEEQIIGQKWDQLSCSMAFEREC